VNVKETKIFEQQIFNKPQLTCFIQVDAQNQFNKFTFIHITIKQNYEFVHNENKLFHSDVPRYQDTNLRYSVLSYWILKMFIEDLHIYSYLIFIVRYL
jgi:hypothetical protein